MHSNTIFFSNLKKTNIFFKNLTGQNNVPLSFVFLKLIMIFPYNLNPKIFTVNLVHVFLNVFQNKCLYKHFLFK